MILLVRQICWAKTRKQRSWDGRESGTWYIARRRTIIVDAAGERYKKVEAEKFCLWGRGIPEIFQDFLRVGISPVMHDSAEHKHGGILDGLRFKKVVGCESRIGVSDGLKKQ